MKVKVCGMRDSGNIQELLKLQPDYIGFIFYRESRRFAESLDEATISSIPGVIKKTGVFVNEELQEIKKQVDKYGLQTIQLHGNESIDFCKSLQQENLEVIKAFGVDEVFDFSGLAEYEDSVDYFLFDTKTSSYGGSGMAFNLSLLERYSLSKSYFLSGGLSPENLQSVKKLNDHRLYAVDLNSKFEIEPGLKDIEKLAKAFDIIRIKSNL